jgi:hypothetical protein
MKGNYDAKQMISLSIRKNLNQTNILRLVFFLSMVIGICIFFSPITTLLGYIPLVGGFLQGTAALIVLLGALLVSIPLFGITFGLAWLRYRPMIGGSVLAVAIIMLIVFSTTKG